MNLGIKNFNLAMIETYELGFLIFLFVLFYARKLLPDLDFELSHFNLLYLVYNPAIY